MTFRSRSLSLLLPLAVLACDAGEPAAPEAAGGAPAAMTPAPSTAPPCDPCLVGPVVLARGRGAPESRTFTFTAAPGARAVLHLDERGSRGANASVILNGATLPWPVDADGRRLHRASLDVTLLAANTLSVRLTGKPGSTLRVALAVAEPPPDLVTLTVVPARENLPVTSGARLGPANGTVTAPGIDCALVDSVASGDCTEAFPAGTAVTLVATPGTRSEFRAFVWNWSGGATGSPRHSLTMTADTTITALFAPLPSRLEVTMVGPGADGWVNGPEIMCYMRDGVATVGEGGCSRTYIGGQLDLTLRALGFGDGDPFLGWEGACTGTAPECRITSLPGDTVRVTARWGR
jgi:hypothetical protein